MGFTYKISYTSTIDRFTGVPIPYAGLPVPAEHRPFLNNLEHWTIRFAMILFPDIPESPTRVRSILDQIGSYSDIVESLVEADLHRYWTREKHEQFVRAFRFFADQGFEFMCSC